MADWAWKSKDGAKAKLLYEPGNWGDLLKAAWVVRIMRVLAGIDSQACQYWDPFAGAPSYPLNQGAEERLAAAQDDVVNAAAAASLADDAWPSAAYFVRSAVPTLSAEALRVFDADGDRRTAWRDASGVSVLAAESGWAVLRESRFAPLALVLVDPYDFLKEWRDALDSVLAAAAQASVLLYVYNRSARGREQLRAYRDFRNALDSAWREQPKRIGRAPADSFLPQSHHEVVFLPGPALQEAPQLECLMDALEASALGIAAAIERGGVVER